MDAEDRDPDPTRELRERLQLAPVLGRSTALAELFRRLETATALDRLRVLLTGETGSGKSLIARVLHENGPRAGRPFVTVNCAAIPRDLWEAEFFGCARSAYTQAAERPGRFAAADGGTLFLDEVGEIPLEQQSKLLRVLDEGHYERLGEDRTRRANVRILAATNRDLAQAVGSGQFRADLYFRLNGYHIHVPSLAERREDIPVLAAELVKRECEALGIPAIAVSRSALGALERREWPGNVRQLHSLLARALIEAHAAGDGQIRPQHVEEPEVCCIPGRGAPPRTATATATATAGRTLDELTREFQREVLRSALLGERGNVSRAARNLGLSRSHFYKLLADLGLSTARSRSAVPRIHRISTA